MEVLNIVIVSLISPKEKIWGQLLQLEPKGATVRGIELDSFDDFIRQLIDQEETTVGMTTVLIRCIAWSGSPSTSRVAAFLPWPNVFALKSG